MAQADAQEAIFDAVQKIAKAAGGSPGPATAAMLRDAAIAYRAAAGGAQVGGLHVDK